MLRYDIHAENGSMYNTPPTYGIYLCGKVFKWLKQKGGIEAIHKINIKKANILYDYLDSSKMFYGTVEKKSRSLMNVCFKSTSEALFK
jgi:phosphoserine aminotransferase